MIKAGYKQTEVGVIPEDWELDCIKSHCLITTGNKNTQDRIENGDYPFFVRSQTIERINSYSFEGEAVLTAGDGVGTGKVFHYINGKFDSHQRVYRITHFSKELDGYYFFLYFSSHFYNRISQMTAKSSVDSVRMEMIADMLIPIPPTKTEQTAIAKALSDTDALIQSLKLLIAKKRQIKQGTMQQLLNPYGENGELKTGWVLRNLGDIANIYRGASPRPIDSPIWFDNSSKIGWVRISDITKSKKYLFKTVQKLSEDGIKQSRFIEKGSLIMSICATVGRPILTTIDVCIHDGFVVFDSCEVNKQYLYYFLSSIESAWSKNGQTGSQMNLNTGLIINTKFPVPIENKEQTQIAKILSDMDTEITTLETKLRKYQKIKQGMMQNLLTGRIRLVTE